jgi:hypothetical protein
MRGGRVSVRVHGAYDYMYCGVGLLLTAVDLCRGSRSSVEWHYDGLRVSRVHRLYLRDHYNQTNRERPLT